MHTPATDALRAHLTTPMGSPLSTTRIPPLMVPGENPNARIIVTGCAAQTERIFIARRNLPNTEKADQRVKLIRQRDRTSDCAAG